MRHWSLSRAFGVGAECENLHVPQLLDPQSKVGWENYVQEKLTEIRVVYSEERHCANDLFRSNKIKLNTINSPPFKIEMK